jgi:hypothetical protein
MNYKESENKYNSGTVGDKKFTNVGGKTATVHLNTAFSGNDSFTSISAPINFTNESSRSPVSVTKNIYTFNPEQIKTMFDPKQFPRYKSFDLGHRPQGQPFVISPVYNQNSLVTGNSAKSLLNNALLQLNDSSAKESKPLLLTQEKDGNVPQESSQLISSRQSDSIQNNQAGIADDSIVRHDKKITNLNKNTALQSVDQLQNGGIEILGQEDATHLQSSNSSQRGGQNIIVPSLEQIQQMQSYLSQEDRSVLVAALKDTPSGKDFIIYGPNKSQLVIPADLVQQIVGLLENKLPATTSKSLPLTQAQNLPAIQFGDIKQENIADTSPTGIEFPLNNPNVTGRDDLNSRVSKIYYTRSSLPQLSLPSSQTPLLTQSPSSITLPIQPHDTNQSLQEFYSQQKNTDRFPSSNSSDRFSSYRSSNDFNGKPTQLNDWAGQNNTNQNIANKVAANPDLMGPLKNAVEKNENEVGVKLKSDQTSGTGKKVSRLQAIKNALMSIIRKILSLLGFKVKDLSSEQNTEINNLVDNTAADLAYNKQVTSERYSQIMYDLTSKIWNIVTLKSLRSGNNSSPSSVYYNKV